LIAVFKFLQRFTMYKAAFKVWRLLSVTFILVLAFPLSGFAYERAPQKPAIVLAAFGTTEVDALGAILNVLGRVKAAFPAYDVHLSFSSNIIREIWHTRAGDAAFRREHPRVPAEIYEIKNPLTTLALIQEQGARDILVQSLHITNGTEYRDQKTVVAQLAAITAFQESKRPFPYLAYGDSALGDGSSAQLERAAEALAPLIKLAGSDGSALVLMGHGNDHYDVQAYRDFGAAMAKKYKYPVFIGQVEGEPGFEAVLAALQEAKISKVLLSPFMLVAGDHARNDMAGSEADSWASQLQAAGFSVKSNLEGLGAINAWADIYVERLQALDAAMRKAAR
jgi:sirohydrochlorin cobaltochelatase